MADGSGDAQDVARGRVTITREERIASNQAALRTADEGVYGWPETREKARRGEKLQLLCECARRACAAEVRLTAAEYEAVRADARRFVLAPGHNLPEAENVVERFDGYLVVEKNEMVKELVERTDPRRRR